ncbi:MAG: LytS/YhcK type 5TM receptor domain-containing protein [Methanomassiliicoccales archaeon]
MTTIEMLVVLIEMICVVIVVAYLLTRTALFREVLKGKVTLRSGIILAILFGLLSIFGTYSGLDILGAKVNVRDLGPMIAGLLAGPFVGIAAGLIGGLQRLTMGGVTAVPCSIATIIAGLLGGIIYLANRRRFIGVKGAVLFAIFMESLHMLINLIIVQPWQTAWAIVSSIGVPIIFANALGMAVFAFIISNYMKEEATKEDRDRLTSELEREKAELSLAQEIQKSMLPRMVPSVPGYTISASSRPAKEVGGDFYDFPPVMGEEAAALIADVSGKGMAAAIYMAVSRTVLKSVASVSDGPDALLRSANRILSEDSDSGMFVTVFGVFLKGDGHFRFANAGHNPPVIIRADGTNEILPEGGVAMGVDGDAAPITGSSRLGPGDLLILYTDGATEAMNVAGEEFGEARLIEAATSGNLSLEDPMPRVLASIDAFVGQAPQYDDITLMVIRRDL